MARQTIDYEEDMMIDIDDLHVEWLQQPDLHYKYTKLVKKQARKVSLLKERVKVVRSQLIKECKTNTPKATGPEIEAYYRTHTQHQEAKDEEINAEYKLGLLEGAVENIAFQRRPALENLVKLLIQGYFAGPESPKQIADYINRQRDSQKIARQKIKGKKGKK